MKRRYGGDIIRRCRPYKEVRLRAIEDGSLKHLLLQLLAKHEEAVTSLNELKNDIIMPKLEELEGKVGAYGTIFKERFTMSPSRI